MSLKQNILQEIKSAVVSVDKEANVILFGSRARGDQKEESDWDILILTDKEVSKDLRWALRSALYDLELKYSIIINSIFRNRLSWEEEAPSGFYQNIEGEGVLI